MLLAFVISVFNAMSTREVSHEPSSAIASMAVWRGGITVHDFTTHYSVVRSDQPGPVDLSTDAAFVES
mgnify:CR=1 FL=1